MERNNRFYLVLVSLLLVLSMATSAVFAIGEVTDEEPPAEPATELSEEEIEALLDEGLAALQSGRFQDAVDLGTTVLNSNPEETQALILRGLAYSQLSRLSLAIDDFTRAIALEPWAFDYHILRGNLFFQQGEPNEALSDYDRAIAIYPLALQAFVNRAQVNYTLGEANAGDVSDSIARGIEASANNNPSQALRFFDNAIQNATDPEIEAVARYNRALVNLNTGNDDDALADFAATLEVDPDLHNVFLARGILYREAGDIVAAGQDFEERINLLGQEFLDESAALGDVLELEMAYRRVYRITFDGSAGDVVTITADDTDQTIIDPLISLLDPSGEAIAGDDDFGSNLSSEIADFELPTDGTYTLLLGHAEGGYAFGFNGLVRVEIAQQ